MCRRAHASLLSSGVFAMAYLVKVARAGLVSTGAGAGDGDGDGAVFINSGVNIDVEKGGAGFNFEVQERVHERLWEFMDGPRSVTGLLAHYHGIGGFGRGLDAGGRDDFLRLCYALMLEFVDMDMIYVGLEDGTFMGYHVSGWGTYREPGESGYDARDPDMAKHYRSCVNSHSGEQMNCTLNTENADFIRCAGECTYLAQCRDQKSQEGCTPPTERDQQRKCGSEVKWCRQYEIVKSMGSDFTLGYVPRTYYCHDKTGTFTEENCKYEDNTTLVNRSHLVGDYAYCGGSGRSCSGTFVGGYRSLDYDHRWRSWYVQAKETQMESWTDPYPFFTNLDMGITFTQPIYSTQGEGEEEIIIFHGAVAVDYSFKLISQFLHQAYSKTSISVVIFEEDDPHYIVGTSTGSKVARKVRSADASTSCPHDGTLDECTAVRIPMTDLSGDPIDDILLRAYLKLREEDFPDGEIRTVTGTKHDGVSVIYAVHSRTWEQRDSNIRWRIMVTMPSTAGDDAAIRRGSKPLFGVVCFIGSLGFFSCLALFGAMYLKRKESAVRCADFFLTETFISGCVLLNLSTFTLLGPNKDALCMSRMWVFHFFFVAALAPLLVKVWRIHKLFKGATSFRRVQITHKQAAGRLLPFVLIELVILTVFSFVDPPKERIVVESVDGVAIEQSYCLRETNAFFATQISYDASLVLFGCILSYLTRNMDPKFGEAKQLVAVLYNLAFVGLIIVIIVRTMDIKETSKIVLKAVGVLWGTVFSVSSFVVPRLLTVRDEKKAKERTRLSVQARRNDKQAAPGQGTNEDESKRKTMPEPNSSNATTQIASNAVSFEA